MKWERLAESPHFFLKTESEEYTPGCDARERYKRASTRQQLHRKLWHT